MPSNPPIFKGHDWATYYASLAQALTTLDHIHDFSIAHHGENTGGMSLRGEVVMLCYNLITEIDTFFADYEIYTQGTQAQIMSAFEITMYLETMRTALMPQSDQYSESASADSLDSVIMKIKKSLKRMEQ